MLLLMVVSTTKGINNLMESETIRIQKDVNALNLNGMPALSRLINVVINKSGDGILGYELQMTVTIKNNDETTTIADYKVNSSGKRVFITNPYNLSE